VLRQRLRHHRTPRWAVLAARRADRARVRRHSRARAPSDPLQQSSRQTPHQGSQAQQPAAQHSRSLLAQQPPGARSCCNCRLQGPPRVCSSRTASWRRGVLVVSPAPTRRASTTGNRHAISWNLSVECVARSRRLLGWASTTQDSIHPLLGWVSHSNRSRCAAGNHVTATRNCMHTRHDARPRWCIVSLAAQCGSAVAATGSCQQLCTTGQLCPRGLLVCDG
jgi:hypothetical protein